MNNKLLRIILLTIAAAVLVRALVGTQRTSVAPREKLEIVVWGFASNGSDRDNDPDIDRIAPPPNLSDFSVARIWEVDSEDDLCMPSEPDALFEEPLLAAHEELLNFQYKYTGDEAEAGDSDLNCADSDSRVSQIAAIPAVAALWDVPDPRKPPAPARYVNDQSAPAADGSSLSQIATSYAGDDSLPVPPAAAPAAPPDAAPAPALPNADVPNDVYPGDTGIGDWDPRDSWWKASWWKALSARVEAIEVSRPAQVVLVGYGIGGKVLGPPFGWDDHEPDMPEESRFILVGGPATVTELGRDGVVALSRTQTSGRRRKQPPALPNQASVLLAPVRASMTSLVLIAAVPEVGRTGPFVIATDDGMLHLCRRDSCTELCKLKKAEDGVWRAVNPDGDVEPPVSSIEPSRASPGRKSIASGPARTAHPWLRIADTSLCPPPDEDSAPDDWDGSHPVCRYIPPGQDVWNVIRASSFVIL